MLRQVLGFVLLLCCASALAAPSVAKSSHQVVHTAMPVIDGEHHHHEDVDLASDQADDAADPKTADKSGHSHLPAPVLDLTLPTGLDSRDALPIGEQLKASDTPALPTLSWIPPIRPPITA